VLAAAAVYGTAWLALACWVASNWSSSGAWARLLWTGGCLANLGHILLAFHVIHGWDEDQVYAAISRQTFEVSGVETGIGLYVNYAFTALWLADTAVWWLLPLFHERRPRWLAGVYQFIFLFMFFNATVIFGRNAVRLLGVALCTLGVVGWLVVRRRAKRLVLR
jgi:hypothetical protein